MKAKAKIKRTPRASRRLRHAARPTPVAGVTVTLRRAPAPRNVDAMIRRMVRVIVGRFKPEQVILFGSRARGDAGPDSDVDLLVIMESAKSKRQDVIDIRGALYSIDIAKDVLVARPDDFAWRRRQVGTIEYPAAKEGKVLYSRQ